MQFRRSLLLLAIMLSCASVSAEITLKKGFWTDWKYSTDSVRYERVGVSGATLRNLMSASPEAQTHMAQYGDAQTWSLVAGWGAGLLVGWTLASYLKNDHRWESNHTRSIGIAFSLGAAAAILESSASYHLKKAVDIYNESEKKNSAVSINIGAVGTGQSGEFALTIRLPL